MRIFRSSLILPKLHCIHLQASSIFEQLQLEEALLRTDERSFLIINSGAPRAIVMGISSRPESLLDLSRAAQENIPVIKRFSGGGTVVIDDQTLFISFIMAKADLNIPPFPESILRWSASLYASAWNIPGFHLQENDYCIGGKKCGGNAQYIRKERWLHHTSFLWDYRKENMELLFLPPKRPAYRGDRSHNDFLCRLRPYGSTLEARIEQLQEVLAKQFCIETGRLEEGWKQKPHRQTTAFAYTAHR